MKKSILLLLVISFSVTGYCYNLRYSFLTGLSISQQSIDANVNQIDVNHKQNLSLIASIEAALSQSNTIWGGADVFYNSFGSEYRYYLESAFGNQILISRDINVDYLSIMPFVKMRYSSLVSPYAKFGFHYSFLIGSEADRQLSEYIENYDFGLGWLLVSKL